jgi:hypothetical protein
LCNLRYSCYADPPLTAVYSLLVMILAVNGIYKIMKKCIYVTSADSQILNGRRIWSLRRRCPATGRKI